MDFAPFQDTTIRGIKVESIEKSNSWFKSMEEYMKNLGGVLGYIRVNDDMTFKSSLDKFMTDEIRNELKEKLSLTKGNVVFLIADSKKCAKLMGQLRIKLGEELNLIDKSKYEFCIVNDFPFYEENEEEGTVEFSHNPFSMPQGGLDSLNNKNPLDILAYQYDFVCNGYEMASGGVRNHSPEILKKAFSIAGYDEEVVKSKFPSLYEAFKYGAPPHIGIAFGLERLVMILSGTENIRDVVTFPKTASASCLMTEAPNIVDEKQLSELGIKLEK